MIIRPSLRIASLAALLVASLASTRADTLTWSDLAFDLPLATLSDQPGPGESLSFSAEWNITRDGFDPSLHELTGIQVWFAFVDELLSPDGPEWVDLFLGGELLLDDQNVDSEFPMVPSITFLALNPIDHPGVFANLATDGILDYTVVMQNLRPDGPLHSPENTSLMLTRIEATGQVKSVPDGGASVGLLGLGLLGLAGLQRRLRN